jgi:flagellar assembly protein FliH
MLYEDFSNQVINTSPVKAMPSNEDASTNDSHRAGFEDGYKEGWVDAQAAAQSETSELNAEVASALQEAGFAYFEARQHIFNSMRPLLEAMVDQVVPALAKDAISYKIVEQLKEMSEKAEPPMHILCAPETAEKLGDILSQHVSFPVEIRTENTLTETQAVLKFADGQTNIDLASIVDGLKSAITDFYDLNQNEDRAHA